MSSSPTATPLSPEVQAKYEALLARMQGYESAITAFSGGIDSSLVAYLAHRELGAQALAVTSGSESLNRDDLALTKDLAGAWGMAHRVIKTQEILNPNYRANPVNRCYYCKTTLYQDLRTLADETGHRVILNGTNADDLGDHRPGLQAASEHAVESPLAECGFTKAEVRALAAHLGLPNHAKPQAACLSSRVPYGFSINVDVLRQIEQAEKYLRTLGFTQLRVRHHDEIARIEVPADEIPALLDYREQVEQQLREYGYRYVTVDLKGFRSGSLNEGLQRRTAQEAPATDSAAPSAGLQP